MIRDKIIAFSHIPKNAGSLITYLLRSRFGTNHCRAFSRGDVYQYEDFKQDLSLYPSLRAISGHPIRPFVDFKEYEGNLVWAVLIRDPYTRFPSQYKWWCKTNKSNMSFEDWCKLKGEKFSNFQCKWIGGRGAFDAAVNTVESKQVVVGFQSDVKGFINKLIKTVKIEDFPWNDDLTVNAATRESLGSYATELIEMYNAEDIRLYDYLKEREKSNHLNGTHWARDFTLRDRTNYYLNLIKHVGIYKPLKKIH